MSEALKEARKQMIDNSWASGSCEAPVVTLTDAIRVLEKLEAALSRSAGPTKHEQVCEMLREMALAKPDMRLEAAASVLLGALLLPTEADIKRGQELQAERTAPDREATICKCGHWLTEHTHTPTEYMECNREECECAGFALAEPPSESAPAPEGMGRDENVHDRKTLAKRYAHEYAFNLHPNESALAALFLKFANDCASRFLAHPTSESGTITPWNCTESHFGIADCKSCGLTFGEQPDFPAIVPERFKAIDPNHGPSLKECNESLAKLISDVWAALEPTGEYEGDKNLVEFAKSIRVAKESAEWSLGRIPELEQQIVTLKAESGRGEEQDDSDAIPGHYAGDYGYCTCGEDCGTGTQFREHIKRVKTSHSQPSVKEKL